MSPSAPFRRDEAADAAVGKLIPVHGHARRLEFEKERLRQNGPFGVSRLRDASAPLHFVHK